MTGIDLDYLAPRPGLEPGTCGLTVHGTNTKFQSLSAKSGPQLQLNGAWQRPLGRVPLPNCGPRFTTLHYAYFGKAWTRDGLNAVRNSYIPSSRSGAASVVFGAVSFACALQFPSFTDVGIQECVRFVGLWCPARYALDPGVAPAWVLVAMRIMRALMAVMTLGRPGRRRCENSTSSRRTDGTNVATYPG